MIGLRSRTALALAAALACIVPPGLAACGSQPAARPAATP
jgi:hypothetical protein